MATATDGLAQIKEVEAEIEALQVDAAEARALVEKTDAAIAERYAKIRDAADALAGDFQLNGSSPSAAKAAAAVAVVKKRGRPKGSKNTVAVVVKKKKRGRPKGSKNTVAVVVKKKGRKAGKKATLASPKMEKAIMAILSDKRKWKKHNPELEAGVEGLSVVELRRTIKGNEMWPENESGKALSDTIGDLKESGKVELIEGRRVKIVK